MELTKLGIARDFKFVSSKHCFSIRRSWLFDSNVSASMGETEKPDLQKTAIERETQQRATTPPKLVWRCRTMVRRSPFLTKPIRPKMESRTFDSAPARRRKTEWAKAVMEEEHQGRGKRPPTRNRGSRSSDLAVSSSRGNGNRVAPQKDCAIWRLWWRPGPTSGIAAPPYMTIVLPSISLSTANPEREVGCRVQENE